MFIELVDVFRCPNDHEETWLVLATRHMDGRDVLDGVLGCPVCEAEFPVVGGTARFDHGRPRQTRAIPSEEGEALRLAALLDLADPKGYAILVGEAASHAPDLRAMSDIQLLLVDPPPGLEMGDGLAGLTTDDLSRVLPLAGGSARAIAFDDAVSAEEVESRLAVVSTGGRILAPARIPLPNGVNELARDDRHWLAERTAAPRSSGMVSIGRRP
jgi:hypothetical protein